MAFFILKSAQANIFNAEPISVEIDISIGLQSFNIIGLADKAVDESKDRVSAAIKNSGFKSPKQRNHKVVVSLAPAHIRKYGTHFDLPIALGYLLGAGDIKCDIRNKIFIGELALDGSVRRISGVTPIIRFAKENNFDEIFIPYENRNEATLIDKIKIIPIKNLRELIAYLNKEIIIEPIKFKRPEELIKIKDDYLIDSIIGQNLAKRAILIAAAGQHNICMYGPPGTGKSMLAKSIIDLLPPLNYNQIIDINSIYSFTGLNKDKIILKPPFRSPHHTASYAAIVGGGNFPKPGEITLSHHGVLFMDELPEFDRKVIDALRQPLEEKIVSVSRINGNSIFPADTLFISALNPCPCGYFDSNKTPCKCSRVEIERYIKKISGPIVDRIDIWIKVSQINYNILKNKQNNPKTYENLIEKILKARKIQNKRYGKNITNSRANISFKDNNLILENSARDILIYSSKKFNLSMRKYTNIIKVARTIADLEESETIKDSHILEALQYRPADFLRGAV